MRKNQLSRMRARGGDRESRSRTARDWMAQFRMVAVLGALLLGLLGVPAGHISASDAATVSTDALYLRSDASTDSPVLATMVQGDRVDVLYGPFDDGWYQVRFDGVDGYAYGGYLTLDGEAGPAQSWGGESAEESADAGAERWIDVDRSSGAVTLYVGDVPQQTLWGSMGWDQSADGFYATANGTYYVYAKNKELTWTSWANAYITDWVAFDADRANGFHSWTMDGSGSVIAGGDGATGGCVGLEPWAADVLFAFADYGMRVEVHW